MFINSIQKRKSDDAMISFGIITPMKYINLFHYLILDYFGTTKNIPSNYFQYSRKNERCLGKNLGKFMMSNMQLLASTLSHMKNTFYKNFAQTCNIPTSIL